MFTRTAKTKTNPVFYADELRLLFADEPERYERLRHDPNSADLFTWNVFASLDTHRDQEWLAYRLQSLGGAGVRAPARLSLWSGRVRAPLLRPSPDYVAWVRQRAARAGGDQASVADFERPIEVPVRIETPEVLTLVDTTLGGVHSGAGGRDRLGELVDAGLEHARRLSKSLTVALVYPSSTPIAVQLSDRVNRLRDPAELARALPHRRRPPVVAFRELSWQQLLAMWEIETRYLRLGGQPVRAFLAHARALGLR